MDQDVLERLASTCTKPRRGQAYQDPATDCPGQLSCQALRPYAAEPYRPPLTLLQPCTVRGESETTFGRDLLRLRRMQLEKEWKAGLVAPTGKHTGMQVPS